MGPFGWNIISRSGSRFTDCFSPQRSALPKVPPVTRWRGGDNCEPPLRTGSATSDDILPIESSDSSVESSNLLVVCGREKIVDGTCRRTPRAARLASCCTLPFEYHSYPAFQLGFRNDGNRLRTTRGFLNGMRHVEAFSTSKGPPPPHFVVLCRFMFSYCGGAPASNDSVTKLPHETRRLSHGPVDGVAVA